MLLLLARMLFELLLDGLRMDAGRHEVVELIAKNAHELGGERLVQNPDRLCAIELIVGGDRPFGDVLARPVAKRLDLLRMGHRSVSSCPRRSRRWNARGGLRVCCPRSEASSAPEPG